METGEKYFLQDDHANDDVLDYKILSELIEFQCKNNPKLKGLTSADIAEQCDMSETTYKGLKKGKNRNPRVGTLVRLLKFIGGGSIDRMVGLAPPRDFAKEQAAYDQTLVETLQARLDAKIEIISEYSREVEVLHTENESLRKELVEAYKDLSAEKSKSNSASENKIRAHKYASAFVCSVVLMLMLLFAIVIALLDAADPNAGFIGGIIWR